MLTYTGERGVTLSGGQSARLAFARSLYAVADIYLLDDILSAVDAKVGRSIFQDAIKGTLVGKTVIVSMLNVFRRRVFSHASFST
jgi:ABC-type multidrug transport system fused ATPase/permease subunit